MSRTGIAIVAVLITGWAAAPAAAMPAGRNARPHVMSAEVAVAGRAVTVTVVGRDRDDVVGGAEISWGANEPAQGLSACTVSSDGSGGGRPGRRARFKLAYAYAAAGDQTITVRVLSGGCGKRAEQRSATRTIAVHVD